MTSTTSTSPRSRRALLAGALGGVAAWAASAAARVSPAEAAAGDPIRMGRINLAGGTSTTLQTAASQPTLRAVQLGGGHALHAEAGTGRAVMATAGPAGTGVWAFSPDHFGVKGQTNIGSAVAGYGLQSGYGVTAVSQTGTALYANSSTGLGLLAISGSSYAALHQGPTHMTQHLDMDERATPAAPPANTARLFARDNAGKTEICVCFATGAVQVIATEP